MNLKNIRQMNKNDLVSILEDTAKGLGLACLVGLAACSTAPVQRPVVEPPKPVIEVPKYPVEQPNNLSPGQLVEMGEVSYQNEDYESSVDFFSRALGTGRLNGRGKVFSYWHLGLSYYALKEGDKGSDALNSFLTIAKDMIEAEEERGLESGGFVEYYKLREKVRYAQLVLDAVWAREASHFGRSLDNPVYIQDKSEIKPFISFVNNCPLTIGGFVEELEGGIYHAILNCDSKFNDEFYFQVVSEIK